MATTVDNLIDLKDMAVGACGQIAALVTDAQLGRKTDMEALSAIARVALEVTERSELYDVADQDDDAVSIEDYEDRHAAPSSDR